MSSKKEQYNVVFTVVLSVANDLRVLISKMVIFQKQDVL